MALLTARRIVDYDAKYLYPNCWLSRLRKNSLSDSFWVYIVHPRMISQTKRFHKFEIIPFYFCNFISSFLLKNTQIGCWRFRRRCCRLRWWVRGPPLPLQPHHQRPVSSFLTMFRHVFNVISWKKWSDTIGIDRLAQTKIFILQRILVLCHVS